ncbi:unnamed protein product [Timema podura]|uniref:Rho-GAP domain-containing protein n=1 Tax=Timema podura TaxID=61482 RepID=A0ABN7NQJ3_TIMPD|nr:unnamed protein product [Timema podura]
MLSYTECGVIKWLPKSSLIGLTSSRTGASSHPPSTPNSGPSSASSLTSMTSLGLDGRPPLASARPKCNSILHLFGEWLFEAAYVGCEGAYQGKTSRSDNTSSKRPNSLLLDSRKGSLSLSQPGSLPDESEIPPSLTSDKYSSGRAEALGALCRIFCAKKTGEEILPVYLARFYLAMAQGLRMPENANVGATHRTSEAYAYTYESRECSETLASVLLNSADLFRLDLDGALVLVPHVIEALETVLPDKELKLRSPHVSKTELRRASIHLLLSMLVLPLHFQNLPIKELCVGGRPDRSNPLLFAQLKPRLMNLLINALQVEADPHNAQMLLVNMLLTDFILMASTFLVSCIQCPCFCCICDYGYKVRPVQHFKSTSRALLFSIAGGLLLCVQDSAAAEEVEQVTQPNNTGPGSDTTSNLLSSGENTAVRCSLHASC